MPQLPLFVFGTLRRGEPNHHYLAGRYSRVLPAVLVGYRRIARLMIAPGPGGEVRGELFWLDPARHAAILAGCDDLEGVAPATLTGPAYQRVRLTVAMSEGAFEAWAYTSSRHG